VKNIKKVVFFGTHEVAVPALETLAELELVPELIVTRPEAGLAPDKLSLRPAEVFPHPVKDWAEAQSLPLVRSRRAAEAELLERIEKIAPDLILVADYGRDLSPEIRATAKRAVLQVHPSCLPKLGGPHAIRVAISQGDRRTGVTVFLVDDDPYLGPILETEEIPLEGHETYGEMVPKVQELACELLAEGIRKVDKSKKPKGRKPNPKTATHTPRITVRHRRAPWQLEAKEIHNRWRAYSPPGLTTSIRLKPVEIVKGDVQPATNAPFGETGTYLGMRGGRIAVLCGRQTVFGIEEVRLKGHDGYINASDAAQILGLKVADQFV
jgi:methionyl-tRNA formyltransferase